MSRSYFYVYAYYRPYGDGSICYIGKGQRERWRAHQRAGVNHQNPHFANIFRKAEREGLTLRCEKLHTGLTEAEALALEMRLIAEIGRADLGTGPLVNLTAGGDQAEYGPVSRARISAALMGHIISPETREKIAAAHRGKKLSPEAIEKTRQAHLGKKQSAEFCALMSKVHKGKTISPEARAKMRAAKLGKKLSPEHRAKLKGKSHGFQKGNRCGALRKNIPRRQEQPSFI